jgi:uncharacterized protein YcfJ
MLSQDQETGRSSWLAFRAKAIRGWTIAAIVAMIVGLSTPWWPPVLDARAVDLTAPRLEAYAVLRQAPPPCRLKHAVAGLAVGALKAPGRVRHYCVGGARFPHATVVSALAAEARTTTK